MSLKRRNTIALILILIAALCWTFGQQQLDTDTPSEIIMTTYPGAVETIHPIEDTAEFSREDGTYPALPTGPIPEVSAPQANASTKNPRSVQFLGISLSFTAVAAGLIAVFGLSQKTPLFGPDGFCMLGGAIFLAYDRLQSMGYTLWDYIYGRFAIATTILGLFLILLVIREIWGWIIARFPIGWLFLQRVTLRCKYPQLSLFLSTTWITISVLSLVYLFFTYGLYDARLPICCFAGSAVLSILQLWRYGADLSHFKIQLDNYQNGLPIAVKNGAFSQTESQLLEVQAQHEEAVRTAVTSERFKVELISNVSHDLRTPLTSILGYSELLQSEALSPNGQEQLHRLHQKAGYMNDLVESLFELTKVSSGVVEGKKEQIDLIRLLEQTVGLFDDQLMHTNLIVKRNYCADTIPVITDGSRMHQVFANLLGNAIKYALAGTRIYLEVKETENSYLIRMLNTASYEMDFNANEIMQRFTRGDKARSTKGSGLGLAIAQTYTESVGGTFRVSVDGDQFSAIVDLPKTERNL